ncbi:MAG: LytTR family DNA-binding domain-containing protein [Pseudobutyrivibrio sp.]|nr:LytTR family DNA-binding domain-containing protein [Pseudobutyrivibrio sp.]
MEIAVVDDVREESILLTGYLTDFEKEFKNDFHITTFESGEIFLERFKGQFDLVLMDIDMPGINGVDTARALRKIDREVVLMFVTAMPQYALSGYEVDAIDYVIKPVSYPDFALKLKKALRFVVMNKADEPLVLQTATGIVSLPISEIYYVESSLHYCIYHTKDQEYRVRESISNAEKKLAPFNFARCNSGYLVALKHVKAIIKDDVQVGDYLLKISRSKKASFTEQFTRLLGGL